MNKKFSKVTHFLLGIVAAIVLLSATLAFLYIGHLGNENLTRSFIEEKTTREQEVFLRRHFNLTGPDEAPNSLRQYALRGFEIMIDTSTHAKDYVGARLNCSNCHFAGGDTTGGPQGGLSLAGVGAKFPAYDSSLQRVIDLPTRINNCFMRSMNGKPVPLDSEIMLCLVTYFQWISKDVPIYSNIPWLGLKPLNSPPTSDPEEGKSLYQNQCSLCHGEKGHGNKTSPPLWGKHSFNDGAGLSRQEMLATFIYWNMPYMQPTPVLTEQQAWNVAAYILQQPRPKFQPKDHP